MPVPPFSFHFVGFTQRSSQTDGQRETDRELIRRSPNLRAVGRAAKRHAFQESVGIATQLLQ